MCGIAGIIDFKKPVAEGLLQSMLESIRHRGPDSEGTLFGEGYSLGMRRLAVIDVSAGQQPIYNETGSIVTFFNGEIYNYVELREQLQAKGHIFKTKTDTEVIVHLYEEYGADFVSKLNGMFAIVLGDLDKKTFYIYRDHFGIKPLYYAWRDGRLVFASEAKAILKTKLLPMEVDTEALVNYLNYNYVPSPKSIFKNIHKLKAGHFLQIRPSDDLKERRWYSLASTYTPVARTQRDLQEEIRSLIEDAVRLQMRSDVPVGAYLSGGVDSSLMSVLAAKHTNMPLSTFSVGFKPSEFDELPYARQVAKHISSNHFEIEVSAEDAISHLPKLMWHLDEPIGDSAILPSFLVSQLAVQHVTVALSGLGGDELFGGYGRYNPVKSKFRYLNGVPKPILKNILLPLSKTVKPGWSDEIENVIRNPNEAEKYYERVRQLTPSAIVALGVADTKRIQNWIGKDIAEAYHEYPGSDEVNARMYTDIKLYMNDQLLQLADRMSMAVSLEARVPILDKRLVELSISIPSHFKISKTQTKIIFKDAIRDLLPAEILDRPKWGFAAPYKTWTLTSGIKKLIEATIEGDLVKDGLLDKKGVEQFLGTPAMIAKHPTWVWPLVALEVWYSQYKTYTR